MPRAIAGALAGLLGGLAGAWVMNGVHAVWFALASRPPRDRSRDAGDGEDTTVKAASALARAFGRELGPEDKRIAGPAVHYGFGAVAGALYGAIGEVVPSATVAAGLPFGAALFVLVDEVAVPAAGLAAPPTPYPLATYARARRRPRR